MQTEDLTPHLSSWPLLAGLTKLLPIAQILGAALFCAVGWYVGSQNAAYTQNARLDALERKTDAQEKASEKVLTREVFEAYRQGDIERADRMEKMLLQILERKK